MALEYVGEAVVDAVEAPVKVAEAAVRAGEDVVEADPERFAMHPDARREQLLRAQTARRSLRKETIGDEMSLVDYVPDGSVGADAATSMESIKGPFQRWPWEWPVAWWPENAANLFWTLMTSGWLLFAAAIVVFILTGTGVFNISARFSTFAPNGGVVPLSTNAAQKDIGTAQIGYFFGVALMWQALVQLLIIYRPYNYFLGYWYKEGVNQRYDVHKFSSALVSWTFIGLVIAMTIGITSILFLVLIWLMLVVACHSFFIAVDTIFYKQSSLFHNMITGARGIKTEPVLDADGNQVYDELGRPKVVGHLKTYPLSQGIEKRVDGGQIASNNNAAASTIKRLSFFIADFYHGGRAHQGEGPYVPKSRAESARDQVFAHGIETRLLETDKSARIAKSTGTLAEEVQNTLVPSTPFEHGMVAWVAIMVVYLAYYGLALHSQDNTYKWYVHVGLWAFLVTITFQFIQQVWYWREWRSEFDGSRGLDTYLNTHLYYGLGCAFKLFIVFIILGGGHNHGVLY